MQKVNFSTILRDHWETMRDARTKRIALGDLFLFIGIPTLVAVFLVLCFEVRVSKDLLNILITAFSVVVALLFNLLMLVYDIIKKNAEEKTELKNRLLKEIYSNVSYCILVSILAVFVMVIAFMNIHGVKRTAISSVIIFGFLINFALTLVMILKRIHILLSKEFDP